MTVKHRTPFENVITAKARGVGYENITWLLLVISRTFLKGPTHLPLVNDLIQPHSDHRNHAVVVENLKRYKSYINNALKSFWGVLILKNSPGLITEKQPALVQSRCPTFVLSPQFSPALSLRTPSPPSSSAAWNTPPCARGKDAGHPSPSSHGEISLHPVTGSIKCKRYGVVMVYGVVTEQPHGRKSYCTYVACTCIQPCV